MDDAYQRRGRGRSSKRRVLGGEFRLVDIYPDAVSLPVTGFGP